MRSAGFSAGGCLIGVSHLDAFKRASAFWIPQAEINDCFRRYFLAPIPAEQTSRGKFA